MWVAGRHACLPWAAGLPKLKIEECAARQQAHIDSNKQARAALPAPRSLRGPGMASLILSWTPGVLLLLVRLSQCASQPCR